jgi:hypothetical protein
MTVTNPVFVLLNKIVDVMLADVPEDGNMSHPVLNDFEVDDSVKMRTPEAGFIDIYGSISSPVIYVGDRLQYKAGARDIENGRIKMKKFTSQASITDDEYRLFESDDSQHQAIAESVASYKRSSNATLLEEIVKSSIQGVADNDPKVQKPLGAGALNAAQAIDNPQDLNATSGTALDLSAYNFTGTAKTVKAMAKTISAVRLGMFKEDVNTKVRMIPQGTPLRVGMHPQSYELMDANNQLENDTSKQERQDTYIEQLAKNRITAISSTHFSSYTYASGNTTTWTFYAPVVRGVRTLKIKRDKSVSKLTWSAWEKYQDQLTDGSKKYMWTSEKDVVLGFLSQPFLINVGTQSKADFEYFKALFRVTVTPYEDS